MPTQFQLDERRGDVIKLNLDDEEEDVAFKEGGTSTGDASSGAVGSGTKQKSSLLI